MRSYFTNIKRAALQLTLPCVPRPPLFQTSSFDMDLSVVDARRLAASREAEAEARAPRTAAQQAAKDAARLAVAGGTSASGAGGGGTEALAQQ